MAKGDLSYIDAHIEATGNVTLMQYWQNYASILFRDFRGKKRIYNTVFVGPNVSTQVAVGSERRFYLVDNSKNTFVMFAADDGEDLYEDIDFIVKDSQQGRGLAWFTIIAALGFLVFGWVTLPIIGYIFGGFFGFVGIWSFATRRDHSADEMHAFVRQNPVQRAQ